MGRGCSDSWSENLNFLVRVRVCCQLLIAITKFLCPDVGNLRICLLRAMVEGGERERSSSTRWNYRLLEAISLSTISLTKSRLTPAERRNL